MNLFPRSKARSFSYAILLGSLLCATGSYLEGRPIPPKSVWLVEAGWLNEHLKDRVIVADTRTEQQYMQGHIPGAVWLDISGIGARTSESALPLLHQELAHLVVLDLFIRLVACSANDLARQIPPHFRKQIIRRIPFLTLGEVPPRLQIISGPGFHLAVTRILHASINY